MESPLRELRSKLGLTVSQLALISEVSTGHISEAENGLCELGDKLERFLLELGERTANIPERHLKYLKQCKATILEHVDMALSGNGK